MFLISSVRRGAALLSPSGIYAAAALAQPSGLFHGVSEILLQDGFRTTGHPRPSIPTHEGMITCSPGRTSTGVRTELLARHKSKEAK